MKIEILKLTGHKDFYKKVILIFCILFFSLYLDVSSTDFALNGYWNIPLQFIERFGASIAALSLIIGLSDMFSVEKNEGISSIVRTTKKGKKEIFKNKIKLTISYITLNTLLIVGISLVVFLFKNKGIGAFKIGNGYSVFNNYFTNIVEYLLQGGLLFLSSILFGIIIVFFSLIFKNNYITIVLSGLVYGIGMADEILNLRIITRFFGRISIYNFMTLSSYDFYFVKNIFIRFVITYLIYLLMKKIWYGRNLYEI